MLANSSVKSASVQSSVQCRIRTFNNEIQLTLWEPATPNDRRERAFTFLAHYRLSSEEEAKQIVSQHFAANSKLNS